MTKITYIPGEIANAAIDEHGNRKPVTRTQHIFDDAEGKSQAEVNKLYGNAISGLNSQNYVTVDSFSSLPATGAVDTVYRVSNWDGTQQDPTVYSEYAWSGSQYVHLSTKTQIGEVFDISAYHATGGTLATYADLTAALGTNGANIPQSLRKGGMSVKYVQTSDNKYVQFRCMAQNFTTDVTQWQGEDTVPTAGSKNLVESDGVFKNENNITSALLKNSSYIYVETGNISSTGEETFNYPSRLKTDYISINGNVSITTNLVGDVRYRYYNQNRNYLGNSYTTSAVYLRLCIENSDMDLYDKYITVNGTTYPVNQYTPTASLDRVEDIEKTYLFGGFINKNSTPTITPSCNKILIYYVALEYGSYTNFPDFLSTTTPKAPINCEAGNVIRCVYAGGVIAGYMTLEYGINLNGSFFGGIINSASAFASRLNTYITKKGLYNSNYYPNGTLLQSFYNSAGTRVINPLAGRIVIDDMLIGSFNKVLGQFVDDIYNNKKISSNGLVDDTDYYVTPYIPITNVQHLIWEVSDNADVYCEAYDSNKIRTNRWIASNGNVTRNIAGNYSYIRATFKKNSIGGLWFDGDLGWSNTNIDVINAISNARRLADGYIYGGCVTPTDSPLLDNGNIFYLAATEGSYTNFGNISIGDAELAVIKQNGNTFTKEVLNYAVDEKPIAGSNHLVKSGGVFKDENNIISALSQNSSYIYVESGNIGSTGGEETYNYPSRLKTDFIAISGNVAVTTNIVGDVRYRYYDDNKNYLGNSYSSSAAYLRLCIENSNMDLYDKYIRVGEVTYPVNQYTPTASLDRVEDIEKTYLFGGYIKTNSSPTITPTSGKIKIYYIALEAGTYLNFPNFLSQETPKAPIYCAAGDVIRCVYVNGELEGYLTLENGSKLTDYFFAGIINSQANFQNRKNFYIVKRGTYGTQYFPDGTLVYSFIDSSGNRIIHRNDNRVIIDSMLIESFNAVLGQFKDDIYDNKKIGSGGLVDDSDYYVTPYIPIDNVQHLIWEVSDNAAVYCEAYDSNKVRTNQWLASNGTVVRTIGGNYSYIRATFKKNGIGGLWFDGVLGWSNTNIDVINAILSAKHLAGGYIYGGCATPSSSPLQDANNIFYLAATEGTYINFGNISVGNTELAVIKQNGNTFTKESVLNYSVDAEEIAAAVADWLDAHPEATTTIQDGAVTPQKLSPSYFHFAESADNNKANTVIGILSGGGNYVRDNSIGCNIAIGYNNMRFNSGIKNLAIGNQNMENCSGDANMGIGYHSAFRLTSGTRNLGVGLESNDDLQTGDDNVAIGGWSLKRNNIGSRNVAIGVNALHGNYGNDTYMDGHDWSDNIAIGYNAGSQILTGASKNILIGNGTTIKNDGENQIVIGHNAAATKNNQVVIGNSSHTEFVLGTKKLIFNNDNTVTWETIS